MDWKPQFPSDQQPPEALRPVTDWWDFMTNASNDAGRPIAYREDTRALLREAGFTDIVHRPIQFPFHFRPSDARESDRKRWWIGMMCGVDGKLEPSFEGLSLSLLTRRLRKDPREVQALCNHVRAAYMANRYPLYNML